MTKLQNSINHRRTNRRVIVNTTKDEKLSLYLQNMERLLDINRSHPDKVLKTISLKYNHLREQI